VHSREETLKRTGTYAQLWSVSELVYLPPHSEVRARVGDGWPTGLRTRLLGIAGRLDTSQAAGYDRTIVCAQKIRTTIP
jgi:hypothetical protein